MSRNNTPLTPQQLAARKKVKARNRKVNQVLVILTLVLTLATSAFMIFNIVQIVLQPSGGSNEVMQTETNRLKNDFYEIGNNPTPIYQDYFKELTAALEANDEQKIAESVVKCFITDYFTWTNKDGNYDVGGSQYIYGEKQLSFIEQSRWQFYSDLDLYIEEYGRENLLEVEEVTITSSAFTPHDDRRLDDGYYVEASWTYKDSSVLNTNEFMHTGFFYVTKGDLSTDRYEIFNFAETWEGYTEALAEAYNMEA